MQKILFNSYEGKKKDGFFKDTSQHLTRKTKTVLNIVTLHLITDFFWRVMKWTSIVALSRDEDAIRDANANAQDARDFGKRG